MATQSSLELGIDSYGKVGRLDFETTSMKASRLLRRDILSGKLKPGQKLTRRALAETYGVSVITILEALYRLESDGLVESQPMYGTRVRPLTHDVFVGEQTMREALECQSARLCAVNLKDDNVYAELKELADILDQSMGFHSNKDGREKHAEFHVKIASVSGVPVLAEEIKKIFMRSFMWATWRSAQQIRTPDDWHNTLLRELRSGDPDRAEAAMRTHVTYNREFLIDILEKGEGYEI